MALSDLAVYSEYAYKTMTEVLRQKIELFNAATGNGLILKPAAHQGDFSDEAFFAKISGGTVRRRNAYGSGAVAHKTLSNLVDRSVKVAAGTPPIDIPPGQFRWIQQNPKVAGAVLGQQMAVDSLADMLNTSIGALVAALSQTTEIVTDKTGATAPANLPNFSNLNDAAAKFGDQSSQIVAWLMHSDAMHKLYGNALTNAQQLFVYGTVNVIRDPFGRLLVMTDSPHLINTTSGTVNTTIGLTPGAAMVGQNNDFDAIEEGKTGDENIQRTYQAEWSYNVGVKGYAWDKTSGGKSPADAALFTSANWDRYATSHKDLAGVLLKTG